MFQSSGGVKSLTFYALFMKTFAHNLPYFHSGLTNRLNVLQHILGSMGVEERDLISITGWHFLIFFWKNTNILLLIGSRDKKLAHDFKPTNHKTGNENPVFLSRPMMPKNGTERQFTDWQFTDLSETAAVSDLFFPCLNSDATADGAVVPEGRPPQELPMDYILVVAVEFAPVARPPSGESESTNRVSK